MSNNHIKYTPPVFSGFVHLFKFYEGVNNRLLIRFWLKTRKMSVYCVVINLPSSCHSVGLRLGRKNRLLDGFFISALPENMGVA